MKENKWASLVRPLSMTALSLSIIALKGVRGKGLVFIM